MAKNYVKVSTPTKPWHTGLLYKQQFLPELRRKLKDVLLLDVTPLSMGIETSGGVMTVLVPRNTTIPTKITDIFYLRRQSTWGFDSSIPGERKLTKDNHNLENFICPNSADAKGVPQIEITYDLDANGILNVSAVEKSSGKENKITITNDNGSLSKDDIERMVNEAEMYKEEDEKNASRIISKNELENLCYTYKNTMGDEKLADKFSDEDKATVEEKVQEYLEWLDSNQDAEKETFEEKKKELEGVVQPIIMKAYSGGMGRGAPGEMPGGMPAAAGAAAGAAAAAATPDSEPQIEEVD